MQATWGFWRRQHPETRVMVMPGVSGRPYTYSEFVPGERPPSNRAHDTSTLGLGLAIGGDAWFFPFGALAAAETPVRMSVDGTTVLIHFDAAGLTAWAENSAGELLMSVLAYERGWQSFCPHTSVWK